MCSCILGPENNFGEERERVPRWLGKGTQAVQEEATKECLEIKIINSLGYNSSQNQWKTNRITLWNQGKWNIITQALMKIYIKIWEERSQFATQVRIIGLQTRKVF